MRPFQDDVLRVLRGVRNHWWPLVVSALAYRAISFILLAPLIGILFRSLLALSGRVVLADFDILTFFLGPMGWVCAILVSSVWLAIKALEQSTLLGVLAAAENGQRLPMLGAFRLAIRKCIPVLRLSAHMVATSLALAVPFLLVGYVIYWLLLTRFDINFYVAHRPREFWLACTLAAITLLAMLWLQLRVVTGWFLSLPILIFERRSPYSSLWNSSQRTAGGRLRIAIWICAGIVSFFVVEGLVIGGLQVVGGWILPASSNWMGLLVVTMGGMLIVWTIANVAINVLFAILFASLNFHFYQRTIPETVPFRSLDLPMVPRQLDARRIQLTRFRAASGLLIAVLASGLIGLLLMKTLAIEDRTLIAAHRGSSFDAPENSMAAIELAISQGAELVEIDVQETADGEVVLLHDRDFKKVAGVELAIANATLKDLEDIDIGSRFSPEFSDQRVPTLGQVLDVCRDRIRVLIELKYYGQEQSLEQRVVDIVEAHGMQSQIEVMSLKGEAVKTLHELRPDWRIGLLVAKALGNLSVADVDFLAVHGNMATRAFIVRAHDSGQQVYVWTINDGLTMSQMFGRGADCLITDKPDLARAILSQREALSPVERLLVELTAFFGIPPKVDEQ